MRNARWAVLVVVALVLAGCSEIPMQGAVRNGSTEGTNNTRIVYLPNPPADGASQRDIVLGFITAASAGRDFRVAKEYLTPGFAARWKPRERVLVQQAQPTITSSGSADLRLQLPITAVVQRDGRYLPSNRTVPLDFHLRQQGGQWRIDQAPDGIVLGQEVFGKIYVPRTLQFFDPTYTRLVPDLRWFPVSSSTGAPSDTTVVNALIAGPAGPIAGGIATNPLQGAKVEAVDSASGDITTVALTVRGAAPDVTGTTRMQQQLLQSLLLPTPSALRLVVNGRVAAQAKPLPVQPKSLAAYVMSRGRFGTLTPTGTFTEERTLGKRIVALGPRAVTVSVRQGLAAVLTGGGDVAAVTGSGSRIVDRRAGLVAPTLDQRGWIYSVPAAAPNGLVASDARGRSVDVVGDLGATGSEVVAIEVSPDGTRMLVLVQAASGPEAFVAGIRRRADGTPIGVTTARYAVGLAGDTGTGIGATWVDDGEVAVLVRAPDNSIDRVRIQPLGGIGFAFGELPSTTSIVGTADEAHLRIRLQTGDVQVRTGNVWQSESAAPVNVSLLAVQR